MVPGGQLPDYLTPNLLLQGQDATNPVGRPHLKSSFAASAIPALPGENEMTEEESGRECFWSASEGNNLFHGRRFQGKKIDLHCARALSKEMAN